MRKKRILITPLNWGLGHATRCIPIIQKLLTAGYDVIIAADKKPLLVLNEALPTLQCIEFPGYEINYVANGSLAFNLLLKAPAIFKSIKAEHKVLEQLVNQYDIDLVISDNRYGCYSKKVPSVFITHQLNIQTPFWGGLVKRINFSFINKFSEVWVPDFPDDNNLSGNLSHGDLIPANTYFIGSLSRLSVKVGVEKTIDILVILSGPEPQRTIFENILLEQLQHIDANLNVVLVRGLPDINEQKKNTLKNVRILNYANAIQLDKLMNEAKVLICRSGYSSIMDIAAVGGKAIFVATPGQTEQEYLAQKMMNEKIAFSMSQEKFDLIFALKESLNYNGFESKINYGLLNTRINNIDKLFV